MKKYIGLSPLTLGSIKFLLLSILLVGCINEDLSDVGLATQTSTLQLNILANSDFSTRAETAPEIIAEQYITRGYIFVFNSSGTQKANYQLNPALDIRSNGDNLPIIKAPIEIAAGEKVAVVLNTAPVSGLNLATVTLTTIDANFPLGNTSNKGFEVVANTTDNTGGLPMYGVHTWSNTPEGNKVIVQRSVAKIQVALAATVGGINAAGFNATSNITYQLHNYAIKGKLKPSDTEGNLNYSDQNQTPISTIANNTITIPTAPASDNFVGARYIYEYKYSTNIIGASSSTTQDIKLPTKNRLAIILYNKQTRKYYRLDLCRVGPSYTDIVRNHHYKLIIKSVNSLGYASAQLALDGAPNNIEYEIVDETGNSTISNGEYAISVGEQPLANKMVSGIIDNPTQTYQVATNVRYIVRDGATLPSTATPNTITVVDADERAIAGASVTPNVLTDKLASLSVTLPTAKDLPSVCFKIQLGKLEFLSTPFSLKSITPIMLDYDCHQLDTRTVHHKYSEITWDVDPTSVFNITNQTSVSFDITPQSENVTPVRWEKWDDVASTYIPSTEAEVSAIPIFAEHFISTGTKADGSVIIIQRFSPIYIGRWGSPIEGVVNATAGDHAALTGTMGQPLRKRAIIEALEETAEVTWGSMLNSGAYNIAHHGLYISTYGEPDAGSNSTHGALNECYKKNQNPSLSVNWYLPAQQQLAGIWVALSEVGYGGKQAFSSRNYWSATESSDRYIWCVYFVSGDVTSSNMAFNSGVRCVRDL